MLKNFQPVHQYFQIQTSGSIDASNFNSPNSFSVLINLDVVVDANFDSRFMQGNLISPSGISSNMLELTSPRKMSYLQLINNSAY
jgi:hypothetical protein